MADAPAASGQQAPEAPSPATAAGGYPPTTHEQAVEIERNPPLLRVPPQLRPSADLWSSLPGKTLAAAHAIAEAVAPAFPAVGTPLSATTMLYVVASTVDRSRVVGQFQIMPALRTQASNRMAVDNAMREWVARITLPSLAVGAVVGAVKAATKGRAPGLARWAPVCAGLAAVPATMPACEAGSDLVMDWAVRPLLNTYMTPDRALAAAGLAGPRADYVAPDPSTLLRSPAAPTPRAGATSPADVDAAVSALLGDIDPLDRERLAWAFDGRTDTTFPELATYAAGTVAAAAASRAAGRASAAARDAAAASAPAGDADAPSEFTQRATESDVEYTARLDALLHRIYRDAEAAVAARRARAAAPPPPPAAAAAKEE